jgi:CarboxypepD_reg-like domain
LKKISLIILLVFSLSIANAQLKPYTDVFRGRVIDAKTNAFIPYALIRIHNTGNYVMSNSNGDFELKIPYSYWRKKTIKFEVKSANYRVNNFSIVTKKRRKTDVVLVKMKPIH